ncbi:hypothetical protein HMPREF1054_0924 [Haemophilus paraphrohaemolyticus HK411]|uniref:Uncharacterized protein n=1 Tax=Haemophilus paraphrohaemolyticus HK411 TaxID=1095743 RepID=I2NFL3_9PAST|nr:hypothetical protein HMPREF1054_0924 [Haemophilus paraphrohaemolyticus HK411]
MTSEQAVESYVFFAKLLFAKLSKDLTAYFRYNVHNFIKSLSREF